MAASSNSEAGDKVAITVIPDVPKLRVVFFGTPAFAALVLQSLIDVKYEIVGCVTKPDRPIGRKQEITECEVKRLAREHGIPVQTPERLTDEAIDAIKEWQPDLIIVVAYGRILPAPLLKVPEFGCINVHASLLPRWRGASPVQNALLAGDKKTGVTIMLLDEGMDTGPILACEATDILPDETRPELEARLAELGGALLLSTIPAYADKRVSPKPQEADGVTLCQLIERTDGRIIWSEDAETINNRFRALLPWPGIFTYWKREDGLVRLKLHHIALVRQSPQLKKRIGEVFEIGEGIGVQTGAGVILLNDIQLEGKERQAIAEFRRGYPDIVGSFLQ